jgi:hypothetical protein
MPPQRNNNPPLEGKKLYSCNCERYCKGRITNVSRSSYQRHAPFRKSSLSNAFITTVSNTTTPDTLALSGRIHESTQVSTGIAGASASAIDVRFPVLQIDLFLHIEKGLYRR